MKPSKSRMLMVVIAAGLVVSNGATAASELILDATADVWVSESSPRLNTNQFHLLQAGVGRGREIGRLVSYIRFDLNEVPESTVFRTTEIKQADLALFAQSSGLAGEEELLFVSVAGCADTEWEEDALSWDTRGCPELTQADDMQLISVADLPQIFRWSVTRSVSEALNAGRSTVTLMVSAFKIEVIPGAREIVPDREYGPELGVGFVRFWSRERGDLSARAAPTLTVGYERRDTQVVRFAAVMLAILSALSVAFGVWEGFRRLTARRPE